MTSKKRFNSYEVFYDRTRKRWPFNTGVCLIEVAVWVGLTVFLCSNRNLNYFNSLYIKKIMWKYIKKKYIYLSGSWRPFLVSKSYKYMVKMYISRFKICNICSVFEFVENIVVVSLWTVFLKSNVKWIVYNLIFLFDWIQINYY